MHNFNIISTLVEENKTSISVILGDQPYIGYILNFNNIAFDSKNEELGVSYSLEIKIPNNQLPKTLIDSEINDLNKIGKEILEKIVIDFLKAYI